MTRGKQRGDVCRFRCTHWVGSEHPKPGHVLVAAGPRVSRTAPKHRPKWVITKIVYPTRPGKTVFRVEAVRLGPEDPITTPWSFWAWDRK